RNNLKLINYFDFIADASKCKNSKPAPDIFLMALKGLNVEAKNCIGIEDAYSSIPEYASSIPIQFLGLNVEAKNCIGIEDAYSGIEAINTSGMHSVGVGSKGILKNANLVVENT